MAEPVTYLLILKNRVGFGNEVEEMLRVFTTDNGSQKKTFPDLYDNSDISIDFPDNGQLILLYDEQYISDSGEESKEKYNRYCKCRAKLIYLLQSSSEVRIFYHRGCDFSMLKAIRDDFEKEYCWGGSDVMPYSRGMGELPWIEGVDSVCNDFNDFLNDNKLSFDDAFRKLNVAWNIAFSYYNVGQPVRIILEALFPLYVDLSNCQLDPLLEEDYKAAVIAANNNLESGLGNIGLEIETLTNILKAGSENLPDDESGKSLAKAGIDLFKVLKDLILDNAKGFQYRFNILSEDYTRYLRLLDVSWKDRIGSG